MNTVGDIAVVVPAYNAAKSIALTMQSIAEACEQVHASGRLFGVVVSDDGSGDDTVQIAQSNWTSSSDLIILKSPNNRGEAAAMMSACQALPAHVKWMLILHSDDTCRPDWIQTLIEGIDLADQSVASVCCSWNTIHADGSVYHGDDRGLAARTITKGNLSSVHQTLITGSWWHISGSAIRIEAYVGTGGRDPNMPQCGDWALLLRWLSKGWDILYLPRVLIEYREHTSSVSSQSFRNHRDVREYILIMHEFAQAYRSSAELLWAHGKLLIMLARRFVSSLGRTDWLRAYRSVVVAGNCTWSALRSLGKRTKRSTGRVKSAAQP